MNSSNCDGNIDGYISNIIKVFPHVSCHISMCKSLSLNFISWQIRMLFNTRWVRLGLSFAYVLGMEVGFL